MVKNKGKVFESDFKSSVPSYCLVHRLKDTAQSYNKSEETSFTWDNPCDFFLYDGESHLFYAIECKSTKYKSMSFQIDKKDKSNKMIKKHQIDSLTDFSEYNGVIAGLFLNFRDEENNCERCYFQNIKDFNNMIKKINKKSFNELDLLVDGNAIRIDGKKKRVYYSWDIDSFLKSMSKEYN